MRGCGIDGALRKVRSPLRAAIAAAVFARGSRSGCTRIGRCANICANLVPEHLPHLRAFGRAGRAQALSRICEVVAAVFAVCAAGFWIVSALVNTPDKFSIHVTHHHKLKQPGPVRDGDPVGVGHSPRATGLGYCATLAESMEFRGGMVCSVLRGKPGSVPDIEVNATSCCLFCRKKAK